MSVQATPESPSPADTASRVGRVPASTPLVGPTGLDRSVCNLQTFKRTAAVLAPEVVTDHLRTITKRAEEVLCGLRGSSSSATTEGKLAVAVHVLAGNAALFGFERLAGAAYDYARSGRTNMSKIEAASDLSTALEATLAEILTLAAWQRRTV